MAEQIPQGIRRSGRPTIVWNQQHRNLVVRIQTSKVSHFAEYRILSNHRFIKNFQLKILSEY